ncbi:MAG: alanine racemase, partial [Bacteroidetes bacterium]
IGVPISLLRMHPQADVAIIEAGISQPGEMEVLAAMIRPTLGVLTHMGPAHAAGFESEQQKLREKLLLFEEVQELICGSAQTAIFEQLQQIQPVLSSAGTEPKDTLRVLDEQISETGRVFSFEYQGLRAKGSLPMKSEADRENALLALLAALRMGITLPEAASRLSLLTPVGMRTEMITDNPEITLINDAYNSDADSIRNALHLLAATENQPRKQLIITDVEHQGEQREEIQRELLAEAEALLGAGNVRTVGPVFAQIGGSRNYPSTDELLRDIRYEDFRDSTLLLKGARRFELERVIPLLNRKLNATFFQINLDALLHNFRTLQARLPEGVKTMCMVKAFSYGSGTWEIARELENAGADYLAVAYASEAIDLRNSGVGLPIMVMNPDSSSLDALIRYEVEPEISNMDILRRYLQAARMAGLASPRIHLKLETGMGRLGFLEEELGEVIAFLQQHPDVTIVSVMSHMAASDDPAEDAFTRQQVARFQAMYARLQSELGVYALRHVLNTPGVLRFPEYAFDMVRLGIGLYGIDPSRSDTGAGLTEMGSLHSSITQIHSYAAGTSIGYGRSQVA